MRADLSTIQQTLTPEAASVLNQSIAEAARRNHGQTTPLHVAATLLSSPSGFLRQACIRSHPNSSHPLQCRALELCFSVALERLPTAASAGQTGSSQAAAAVEPAISNALMAALKRAQAHQRRGCPEQQQQPLLAVKVELEQLIISILDDPSVSRVMREASFSSPDVKAAIEQSLMSNPNSNSSNILPAGPVNPSPVGFGFRSGPAPVNRNLYLNPRLQQKGVAQTGQQRTDELKRVIDILLRANKRNPVLVGESEPQILVKELLGKMENRELPDSQLRNLQVIRLEKELGSDNTETATRITEISGLIETRMGDSDLGSVILDLGDLKWLVENHQMGGGRGAAAASAVAEMRKLLERYGARLWLIGTATCETYLRCQVYHPSMESEWGLQAVPIAAKSPLPGMFPRLGKNGSSLSYPVESMFPMRNFPVTAAALPGRAIESLDPSRRMSCCPQCIQNYKNDLAKIEKSKSEAARPRLPQWLQNVKAGDGDAKSVDKTSVSANYIQAVKILPMNDQELLELQKKWKETCFRLHHSHRQQPNLIGSERIDPPPVSLQSLCGVISHQSPKLQPNLSVTPQLNPNSGGSPPESPVRTDLVLGRPKKTDSTAEKTREQRGGDILGNKIEILKGDKLGDSLGIDTLKRLLKGLTEKVWWQHDAASAVATTVSRCKLGNGKRRGVSSKSDVWLLFVGPDRVGKKMMASALSELINGSNPITINLGTRRDDGNTEFSFRGKTALDRIAESVKRNPFSVIVLEDIEDADMLLCGNIKRAMERGRICDSHGREISLGNVIFVLTANWSMEKKKDFLSEGSVAIDEDKLHGLVGGGWQLRLHVSEKTSKRRPSWLYTDDEERPKRHRKQISSRLSFDLNEAADVGDDKAIGLSGNSSDLSIDHDQEDNGIAKILSHTVPDACRGLLNYTDDTIFFRPVDFGLVKHTTEEYLKGRLSSVVSDKLTMEIKDDALEKIAGGIWLGRIGLQEWVEKVFVPNLNQIKSRLSSNQDEHVSLLLELDEDFDDRNSGDFSPRIKIATSME